MEIVEEVGLVICERGVIGQRARLLIGRSAQGDLAPATSTWKRKKYKSRFKRMKWKMGETNKECKARVEERTDNQLRRMTHGWDDAHKHLSQCRMTDHYTCAL